MVSFGHTAVGVIIGTTAYKFLGQGDLASGLIITGTAGFVSHYIMDSIPHGHFFMSNDFKRNILPIIVFDLSLSIMLFLGILYLKIGFDEKLQYVMFGIGGSQLPDVIDGLIYTKIIKARGLLKGEKSFHEAIHWHGRNTKTLLLGIRDIWQVLIILIALFLVIFKIN